MSSGPRLAERALDLVRIPSVYGDERALCDHLEAWAKPRYDDAVVRVGHSLVLGRPVPGQENVALVGHLDTVPPHDGDPEPHLEGDRLVGLGASDMKGGLAVATALVEDLPAPPVLVLYEKEEGPHADSGLGPVLDACPFLQDLDLAVVMEPTDGVVQVGCVGSIHATLTFAGKSAHSARPWHGHNAVTAAGALLAELHDRVPMDVAFGEHVFREVMTVTDARGGRYRNVVPDRFELNLNYRFAPGKSLDVAQREIEAFVAGRAAIAFTDLSPSGAVPEGNAAFERLLSVTGLPSAPKQAWTDVARLSEAGIDAVNYGPGETGQAHQAGESCSVAALVAAYGALMKFFGAGA